MNVQSRHMLLGQRDGLVGVLEHPASTALDLHLAAILGIQSIWHYTTTVLLLHPWEAVYNVRIP